MVRSLSLCVVVGVAFVIAVAHAKVSDRRGPLNLSFSKMAVYMEEGCSREGGLCLEKEECPEGKLLKKGLCPEQQKRGVECCAGLPLSLKECRGLGGECMKTCPENFRIKKADDCETTEVCCRLE